MAQKKAAVSKKSKSTTQKKTLNRTVKKTSSLRLATKTKKKLLLDALEKNLGIVTTACRETGIAKTTFYEWYNKDEDFRAKADAVQEIVLDFAESKLYQKIDKGDTIATLFYLKCKGKKRGYIEKQEVEHSGQIVFSLSRHEDSL